MELATEFPDEHAPSSVTSSPSSIIDRKRELKAIPNSFSYNLGRRGGAGPPPARLDLSSPGGHHSPSRSVRSIVAWIESSSAAGRSSSSQRSSGLSASDDGSATAAIRSTASSYKLHGGLGVQSSPPRCPREPGVDSDCPTFLGYQQYFARESSLAQSLHEQPPKLEMSSTAEAERETREPALRRRHQERRGSSRGRLLTGGEGEKRSPAEVAAL